MNGKKLRFLFIQPEFHKHYIQFFPVYEPLHFLVFEAVTRDIAESRMVDRRFDTEENLARVIREFQPDIVGATTHTAGEIYNVARIFKLVKSIVPNAKTIVGGQHATLLPEDLYTPETDLVCIGPGEETLRQTMEAMLSGADLTKVPGLAVKQNGKYVITPPRLIQSGTMSWPPFNRSLLPQQYKKHYLQTFERMTTVYTLTTSGCPYRCKFCSLWASARGTYRRRKPAEVVEDIASQPQPYVHLTDDNTFHDEAQATEIYELLKKRGIKKKILAYARADMIVKKPYLLAKWKEVGLGALVVGMEAVSDKHLTSINKKSSVDLNVQAHKVMESLGIENWAHFVILPEFTKEDFDAVWDFCDRLNVTYPIFVPYTAVPGTPLFYEEKAKGNIATLDYAFYNLEYMVLKTKIPKEEWYQHLIDLYMKSCSLRTLLKRRASPAFHWRPALGRAYMFRYAPRSICSSLMEHVAEQLHIERDLTYEQLEPTMPPSLRRDFKTDQYYHVTSVDVSMRGDESPKTGPDEMKTEKRLPGAAAAQGELAFSAAGV